MGHELRFEVAGDLKVKGSMNDEIYGFIKCYPSDSYQEEKWVFVPEWGQTLSSIQLEEIVEKLKALEGTR